MAGFGAIVGLAIGGVAGAFTVGLVVAFAGLGAGALVFGLYGVALFVASILYSALMMLLGWGCAFLITRLAMRTEPWRMTIRGYRRLSDRESLVVVPLVDEIAAAMTVKTLPTILIHDIPAPGAWTHTQHVVLSKRSLDLERRELAAMIAHEMHHYRSGDAKKGIFIWACAFPVAFLAEFQKLVRDRGGKLLSFLIGIFLWPAVVMLRFAIAAAMGADNRQREYAADAAVVDAGYGDGFIRLLETIRVFEPGRSNWDSVMAATHPPIEFRIEAVQRRLSPPEIELQTLPPLPADSPM
jgi:Zn-dependent protease with chaperone function